MRENLESDFRRHSKVENISKFIEKGQKPPYEVFKNFVEGNTDPQINRKGTEKMIREAVERGEIKEGDFNMMICSTAKRAEQTAGVINKSLQTNLPIRSTPRLLEGRFSFEDIPREVYEEAKDIHEVRKFYLESFLKGKKIDEGPVELYQRAQGVLRYFNKVKSLTEAKPLFISHGIFLRTLELAINHNQEKLDDQQVLELMQNELKDTPHPHVLGGLVVRSDKEGKLEVTGRLELGSTDKVGDQEDEPSND